MQDPQQPQKPPATSSDSSHKAASNPDHTNTTPHTGPEADNQPASSPQQGGFTSREHVIRLVDDAAAQAATVNDELAHLNRLATLGTIAASIAHEINNLLTPVVAYAQLARSHADDEQLMRKALDRAGRGAEAATVIAQAMLDFARPGFSDEDAGEANIVQTLEQTLACLGRSPEKDGIHLDVDVPEKLRVSMQAVVLQQVMMNLLLNATDAMRRSGQGDCLSIRAREAEGQPKMVELIIADNGPGMPTELAAHAFQPFAKRQAVSHTSNQQRAKTAHDATKLPAEDCADRDAADDAAHSSQRSGAGLGLSICQRLLEQAGGSISLYSAPGRGAAFHVLLPRATKHSKNNGNHAQNDAAHTSRDRSHSQSDHHTDTPVRAVG